MNKEAMDVFHKHLDECYQCCNQPFNLCPTGVKLILETQKPVEKKR